ncbi:MAG TPA: DUF4386 domain-containing protein [Terriglobales bacterium]|nr:DUF4386 domain-containing protein [Terriglobales bacterium]
MLHPVIASTGFLTNAADHAFQVRSAVLLLFFGSAIPMCIAIAGFAAFREYSQGMAMWLVTLAIDAFSLQAFDNSALMAMLTLSQRYAEAGTAKLESFQALALVVGSARKWAHYSALLAVGCWMFSLFAFLYRYRMVPHVLAGFGAIASLIRSEPLPCAAFLAIHPKHVWPSH